MLSVCDNDFNGHFAFAFCTVAVLKKRKIIKTIQPTNYMQIYSRRHPFWKINSTKSIKVIVIIDKDKDQRLLSVIFNP